MPMHKQSTGIHHRRVSNTFLPYSSLPPLKDGGVHGSDVAGILKGSGRARGIRPTEGNHQQGGQEDGGAAVPVLLWFRKENLCSDYKIKHISESSHMVEHHVNLCMRHL